MEEIPSKIQCLNSGYIIRQRRNVNKNICKTSSEKNLMAQTALNLQICNNALRLGFFILSMWSLKQRNENTAFVNRISKTV